MNAVSRTVVRVLLLGLAIHMLMSPYPVFAVEDETEMPVDSGVLGGGSSSDSDSPLPDLFTGAMSYKIPIEVPPGRNGMKPDLALTYRSNNGNGWVGVGWELEVGAIERSTRRGVDYSKDIYILRRAGSVSELVYDDATGAYRSKIESDFLRIQRQPDGSFIATNKLGVKYFFGQTENSRVTGDLNHTSFFFRWSLDKIEDTNGNIIRYTYSSDRIVQGNNGNILVNGSRYLDHIDYNGNLIKFYLEDRTDAPEMYTTKFLIKTAKRLKTIDIQGADHSHMRTYKLAYTSSVSTGRSILSSVQQFGKDAIVDVNGNITNEGTATKLPAQTFNVSSHANGILETQSPLSQNVWGPDPMFIRAGDFNGDGRMDIASANGGSIYVKLSKPGLNGSINFEEQTWTTTSPNWGLAGFTWTGDFNGDGRMDIATASGGTIWVKVSKVDQNGKDIFEQKEWTTTSPNWGLAGFTWVGDFNGDGRMDIATANGGTIWVKVSKVDLNGNDIFEQQVWTTTATYWGEATYTWAGDFNGDGRTDIATARGGTIRVKVSKFDQSTGKYIFEEQEWTTTAPTWGEAKFTRVGDFNGDGRMDIATVNGGTIRVKVSKVDQNGKDIFEEQIWTADAPSWGDALYVWVGDFNGDGRSDIATARGGTTWVKLSKNDQHGKDIFEEQTWTTNAPNWGDANHTWVGDFDGDGKTGIATATGGSIWVKHPEYFQVDKIIRIDNGLGGHIDIDYTPSTYFSNLSLPFPVQAVTIIRRNDEEATEISYSGGYYHIADKDFRGFNHVTVKGPVGPNGEKKVTETWFHQGIDTDIIEENTSMDGLKSLANIPNGFMKGKPYRVRISDSNGHIFSETETTYAAAKYFPWFNPPKEVHTYICDGNFIGNCKDNVNARHLKTEYLYDSDVTSGREYGNLSAEYRHGDVNDPSDDSTIYRTYSPNTAAWIVGLLASETIFKGTSNLEIVAYTSYFYDGVMDCSSSSQNQTPNKGRLTSVFRWLKQYEGNPQTYIEERKGYDDFGNLFCRRDAKGNTTTIGYDSSHTFPVTVTTPRPTPTSPSGLVTTTRYYGVDGVLTAADKGYYGQVESVADPNNAVTTYEYDAFGRKKKITPPDGVWTSWDYLNYGNISLQRNRKTTSDNIVSDSFFDGLGRTTFVKKTWPGSDLMGITTFYEYDSRGALNRKTSPFLYSTEVIAWTSYVYDPLGRVTSVTTPLTATSNISTRSCYNRDVTVTIDPNNHRRREVRDANGRLTTVQEYKGTFSSCSTEEGTPYATTTYKYDVLGNLTDVNDIKGNKTEIRYDSLGRKRYMSDPDMGIWTYDYDANGNLSSRTDANHKTITYAYDALNRLASKHYVTGLGEIPIPDVVLTYDEVNPGYFNKGRLTKMTDASGQTVYNYDNMGRIATTKKTIGGLTYPSLSYGYSNGRLSSVTYPSPDSEMVSYGYHPDGNLKTVGSYATFSKYDSLGRPGKIVYGNGTSTVFTYDPINRRLTDLKVSGPSPSLVPLIDNGYGYDNKRNITSINDRLNTPLPTNLSGETYTPVRAHAVGSTGSGKTFSYDDNGNIKNDGTRDIKYNRENMPTDIGTVGFVYDGNGMRVKKTSPVATTVYVDKLYECVIGGQCAKYIFAANKRIALKDATDTLYYHPDHQGSTSVVTTSITTPVNTSNGAKFERIAYSPSGETSPDRVDGVNHLYTGQELDHETGLYNYNARIYDPSLGRFNTPDSIVPDYTNPQSLNRYAYALNNPMRFNDPTGHYFEDTSGDFEYNFNVNTEINNNNFATTTTASYDYSLNNYSYGMNQSTLSDPYGTYSINNPNNIQFDTIQLARADVYAWPNSGGGFAYTAVDDQGSKQLTGTFNTGTTLNVNQLPAGDYKVTPRPYVSDPGPLGIIRDFFMGDRNRNAGNPTISNTDDWNQVRFPDGSIHQGIQIHPGRAGSDSGNSLGCLVCTQGQFNQLNQMFWKNYNTGGVNLHIFPNAP